MFSNLSPLILPYKNKSPQIPKNAFIAPNAVIIGDVEIGEDAGIWFNCVIRGDVASIKIGHNTNVQDSTVIHVMRNIGPTIIGSNVTIGHKALIHACTIKDNAFIGMGAIIMDGVIIESYSMIAAGALVTPNKHIKKGEIWAGNPAKFFRNMTQKEINYIEISKNNYTIHAHEYIKMLYNKNSL